MAERKSITKSSNLKAWVDWTFFAHSCYNYERLQSVAVAQAMYHPLASLYDTKEEIARELEKHLTFFNTNPSWGGIILGVVIAMEEERANTGGADSAVTPESIIAFKTGMMGPFAGLGDTIGQGILSPLFLSISITMAEQGNMFAPWFNLIVMGIINIGVAYVTWMYGYKFGVDAIDKVLSSGAMDQLMLFAGILGCLALGGLASTQVKLLTPLSFQLSTAVVNPNAGQPGQAAMLNPKFMVIQTDLFDPLFKGLLSLGLMMGVLGMMRKSVTPLKIIMILAVVAFALGAFGIVGTSAPKSDALVKSWWAANGGAPAIAK
ncbi:MAG: PTS system mannose/fructose/sorbose family transporter subunit IID [Stenotrophomonas sp.]